MDLSLRADGRDIKQEPQNIVYGEARTFTRVRPNQRGGSEERRCRGCCRGPGHLDREEGNASGSHRALPVPAHGARAGSNQGNRFRGEPTLGPEGEDGPRKTTAHRDPERLDCLQQGPPERGAQVEEVEVPERGAALTGYGYGPGPVSTRTRLGVSGVTGYAPHRGAPVAVAPHTPPLGDPTGYAIVRKAGLLALGRRPPRLLCWREDRSRSHGLETTRVSGVAELGFHTATERVSL